MIKKKISTKFAKIVATSLFYSKLAYHVEAYASTTLTNKRKINKLILKLAKFLNGPSGIGKSDNWHMNELGWMDIENLYKFAISKYTYRIIHSNQDHMFKSYLLSNRSDQKRMADKLGPHKISIGRSNATFPTYLYQAIDIYNKLPDNLTQMSQNSLFKIWLKK